MNKNLLVAIQPIGNVSNERIAIVKESLISAYHLRVVVLRSVVPPEESFVNIKSPRYRADKLLEFLFAHKPDSADYIMGITGYDISFTKRDGSGKIKLPESKYADFGIFGLGYRPGASCIVSYFRFGSDELQSKNRLAKVSIHELGHNFGLPHCPNKRCVMADAVEKISSIDNATMKLCEACLKEKS